MTLEEDMSYWLSVFKRNELKESSYGNMVRNCSHNIYPYLGELETSSVTTKQVQELLNNLHYEKNLSFSVVRKVHDALNGFFRYAKNMGMVEHNVVEPTVIKDKNRVPRSKRKISVLSEKQLNDFIEVCLSQKEDGSFKYYYGPLMLVYLNTGCRKGELCACTLDDYDRENSLLNIHSDVYMCCNVDGNGRIIKGAHLVKQDTPKTPDSNRVIYLNEVARKCLDYYVRRAERLNLNCLIPNATGKAAAPYCVYEGFKRIIKAAGYGDDGIKGVHTLRHSFATMLLNETGDVKSVSLVLGHHGVEETLNTYIDRTAQDVNTCVSSLEHRFTKYL